MNAQASRPADPNESSDPKGGEEFLPLFQGMEEGFCILERVEGAPVDFRYILVNPAFATQCGVEGRIGETVRQAFPKESEDGFLICDTVLRTGKPAWFEYELAENGRSLELSAFRIEDGPHERVAFIFKDVTKRKQAEKQLRRESNELEAALTAADVGKWTWDVQTDRVAGDKKAALLFGVDAHEAIGGMPAERYIQRLHPDDQAVLRGRIQEALQSGGSYELEFRIVGSDGEHRWLASRGRAQQDDQGRPHLLNGVVLDITERKMAEEELRESEERLRFVLEAGGGVGTWDWDVAADRLYSNERFATLFSVIPERAAAGAPLAEFVDGIHPIDRARVAAAIQKAVETGEEYAIEYRLARKDAPVHWVSARGRCHRDRNGRPTRFPGVVFEITERKRAEEDVRRKNDELTRTNQELEEFAYVASHDLQEPLRMVNIYSQLLLRQLGNATTDDQRECAEYIEHGVKRMEQLIGDLLSYSRTVHAVNAEAELSNADADLEESLKEALLCFDSPVEEIRAFITHDPLPTVRGDVMQFSQVFQNLISNALKYRNPERTPEIHISVERRDAEWVLSVHDNGIGFEPAYAERIFGLFKRLHRDEEYPGTGLGLAICKRIVERYGGTMWAESKPGTGSRFFFSLPTAM